MSIRSHGILACLGVVSAILWLTGFSQLWLFWESTRQWTAALEWLQHIRWLSTGIQISNVGNNGPLPIYVYGLVLGLVRSEWSLPALTTILYGINGLLTYRWLRQRYEGALAALISLALFSNPIVWPLVRAGLEFSFAIVLAPYLAYLLIQSEHRTTIGLSDIAFGFLVTAILQFEKTFAPVAPILIVIYALRRKAWISLVPTVVWGTIFLLPAVLHSHVPIHLAYGWDAQMLHRIFRLWVAQYDVLDAPTIPPMAAVAYVTAGLSCAGLTAIVVHGSALQRGLLAAAMANVLALAYTPESNHHLLVYMVSALVIFHGLGIVGLASNTRWRTPALYLACTLQLTAISWQTLATHKYQAVSLTNWYPLRSPATIDVPTVRAHHNRLHLQAADPSSVQPDLNYLLEEVGSEALVSGALKASDIGLLPDITWRAILNQAGAPLPVPAPAHSTDPTQTWALDVSGAVVDYDSLRNGMYGSQRVMGLAVIPYGLANFPRNIDTRGATYVVVREPNFPLEFYDHRAPKLVMRGVEPPSRTTHTYFGQEHWYRIRSPQIRVEFQMADNTAPYFLGLIRFEPDRSRAVPNP